MTPDVKLDSWNFLVGRWPVCSVVLKAIFMNLKTIAKLLFASVTPLLFAGCLTEETVTRNGEVMKSGYVFKRPLKDAIEASE